MPSKKVLSDHAFTKSQCECVRGGHSLQTHCVSALTSLQATSARGACNDTALAPESLQGLLERQHQDLAQLSAQPAALEWGTSSYLAVPSCPCSNVLSCSYAWRATQQVIAEKGKSASDREERKGAEARCRNKESLAEGKTCCPRIAFGYADCMRVGLVRLTVQHSPPRCLDTLMLHAETDQHNLHLHLQSSHMCGCMHSSRCTSAAQGHHMLGILPKNGVCLRGQPGVSASVYMHGQAQQGSSCQ